jgi:two-component system chemotaxis response regulator CheY
MINPEDDLAQDYLAESCEQLSGTEMDILAWKQAGGTIDDERIDRIFLAVRSVRAGAVFFDLARIRELAQRMEHAVALIRSHGMTARPEQLDVLLLACDKLHGLAEDADGSNGADIRETVEALAGICGSAGGANPLRPEAVLRVLLVEDDFAGRLVLQKFLSRYGACHIAVNGREAVDAFRSALEQGRGYHLVCMDIMMPEMDGREALGRMRALEDARGIHSTAGAKIIMTTAVDEIKSVSRCFMDLCDAYLRKPVELAKLLALMKEFRLVE